jgi:ABC-type transport system involved in cytochrome c biogenesis permease subunit
MDNFSTPQLIQAEDKFKLGKKWFWIGIVTAFLNIIAGLVYGIALTFEKEHRREGLVIIGFVVLWGIVLFAAFGFKSDLLRFLK